MLHTSLYILAMGYFNKAKKKAGGGGKQKAKEKNQQKKNSAESNSVNKYSNL